MIVVFCFVVLVVAVVAVVVVGGVVVVFLPRTCCQLRQEESPDNHRFPCIVTNACPRLLLTTDATVVAATSHRNQSPYT